jgi:hypothetical protein
VVGGGTLVMSAQVGATAMRRAASAFVQEGKRLAASSRRGALEQTGPPPSVLAALCTELHLCHP